MINIVLAVFCSTSIALLLKYNDSKSGNALLLLSGNYFTASVISFLFYASEISSTVSWQTILFGAALAVVFVFSFFSFTKAVNIAGTALATISSRISVIVPVILSILLYAEKVEIFHIAGFLFTIITIVFFYKSLSSNKTKKLSIKDYFYLAAVLFGVGTADFGMKVFEQWRPISEKSFFLFSIFGFSFIYTIVLHFRSTHKFDKRSFVRGNLLGIPNMFSSYFLIGALSILPAVIVYPIINVGIIVMTALAAYLIWREKLNIFGIIALITGVFSIILLSL